MRGHIKDAGIVTDVSNRGGSVLDPDAAQANHKIARPDFRRKRGEEQDSDNKTLYNLELERGILGGLLYDNTALERLSALIGPDDFFDPLHKLIFDTAAKVIQRGKPANPITLRTYFEACPPVREGVTAPKYLGELVAEMPSVLNLSAYAEELHEHSLRRSAIVLLEDALAQVKTPDPAAPVTAVFDGISVDVDRLRSSAGPLADFGSLQLADETPAELVSPYLIKGVLSATDTGVVYGPTGVAKTFAALDFAWHIPQGKSWRGRRVKRAAVLFVPLEGRGLFRNRLRAMTMEHGSTDGRLAWIDAPINLSRGPIGNASEAHLIREAKALARRCPEGIGAIIIDTLARALGGDTENDADSVAALMARVDRIKQATGAAVIFTAHPGKDESKGLRGSYALSAALDFVIRIDRDGKAAERTVTLEKMRDGEEGPIDAFTLKEIHLGTDQDGDDVTSCVLVPAPVSKAPKPKMPKAGSAAASALNELSHCPSKRVQHDRIPDWAQCVEIADWRTACKRKGLSKDAEADSDKRADAEKKAFRRAAEALGAAGLIGRYGELVWRTKADLGGHSGSDADNYNNSEA